LAVPIAVTELAVLDGAQLSKEGPLVGDGEPVAGLEF